MKNVTTRFLYKIASTAALLPAVGASLLASDLREGLWRRFVPPRAQVQPDGKTRIWIHAASAGEVRLAARLSTELRRFIPGVTLLLTTNTTSGVRVAQVSGFEGVFRFPFDVFPSLKRLFSILAPHAIVLMEMELWPGLIELARTQRVPVLVANARMSRTRADQFRRWGSLFGDLLAYPGYLTRDDDDLNNLHAAGVPLSRLLVTGDMKIDLSARPPGQRPSPLPRDLTLLGVSTHPGEETVLLESLAALRRTYPDARLILAPRHVRRTPEVLALAAQAGFSARPIGEDGTAALHRADVWVEDRFGRMNLLYPLASAVFVGGSLIEAGGHNVLEPVMAGRPVLTGPHVANWRNWVSLLDEGGALSIVKTSDDICRILGIVIEEAEEVGRILVAVKVRLDQQAGTAARNARLIRDLLTGGDPFALRD